MKFDAGEMLFTFRFELPEFFICVIPLVLAIFNPSALTLYNVLDTTA